jgi:hypothetical protein
VGKREGKTPPREIRRRFVNYTVKDLKKEYDRRIWTGLT